MRGWLATPRRRALLGLLLAGLVLLGLDLTRPPQAQATTRAALAAIDFYQAVLSPLLRQSGTRCRFRPTCSLYGEAVIRRHGLLVGGAKTAWRILRCGPWTPVGTEDLPDDAPARPSSGRVEDTTRQARRLAAAPAPWRAEPAAPASRSHRSSTATA